MNRNQRTYLYGCGWKRREVTIQIGLTYEIQPLNQRKKLNRGRHCTILGFKGKIRTPLNPESDRVRGRWQDDNSIAFVDPTDLIPVNNEHQTIQAAEA